MPRRLKPRGPYLERVALLHDENTFFFVCLSILFTDGGGLVAKSCPTLVTPWTVARQAPLSMGFYRQEYWSGFLCPSPGDLPNPGIEPRPPALQANSLLTTIQITGTVCK